jgi:hypothetical protein
MKCSIYVVAGLAILGVAAIVPAANATALAGCVNDDPLEHQGDPNLVFQPIPTGCAATNNGVPIVFANVPDENGVLQTVTLADLVIFTPSFNPFYSPPEHGEELFIDGTIGTTPASSLSGVRFLDWEPTVPLADQVLGVTTPISGVPFTLVDDPSSGFELGIDSAPAPSATQLVTSLGGGLYDSTGAFDMTLELTLNGGTTWVTEDPTFTLENFNAANYPNLGPLLGVPEPATLAVFGAGLLGLGFMYRRRVERRAIKQI